MSRFVNLLWVFGGPQVSEQLGDDHGMSTTPLHLGEMGEGILI